MNSSLWTKRLLVAGVLAACVLGGTTWIGAQGTSGSGAAAAPGSGPTAGAAAATAPGDDQPMAVVNGKEINNKKFNELLMQVAGLRVFQEVLDLVLVQQACAQAGIPVEGEEFRKHVQEELDRTLAGLEAQGVAKEQREQALATLLQRQGVTDVEFQMGLQRAAGLRQLAKSRVDKPTEAEINQAFVAQYGPKVQIEVLTVKDRTVAAEVRTLIEKGEEPRAVASARGITLQAVTISSNNTDKDPIATFKKLAFEDLKEKQLSSVYPYTTPQGVVVNYMVYLDKKIAKQDVLLPTVQKKVEEDVLAMKESNWMNQQLVQLRTMAQVKINDRILNDQFRAIKAAMERNATQPASPMLPAGSTTLPAATLPAVIPPAMPR